MAVAKAGVPKCFTTTPVAEPPVNVQRGCSCRLILHLECLAVVLVLGVVVVDVVADPVHGEEQESEEDG